MTAPNPYREGQADQLSPLASCALLCVALMLMFALVVFMIVLNGR